MFNSQAWRGKTKRQMELKKCEQTQCATNFATLTLPSGETVQLPILEGTAGPRMIDIRSLYQQTGMFTYDPGFTCTGSCDSKITFIDGGILSLSFHIPILGADSEV